MAVCAESEKLFFETASVNILTGEYKSALFKFALCSVPQEDRGKNISFTGVFFSFFLILLNSKEKGRRNPGLRNYTAHLSLSSSKVKAGVEIRVWLA